MHENFPGAAFSSTCVLRGFWHFALELVMGALGLRDIEILNVITDVPGMPVQCPLGVCTGFCAEYSKP